MATQPIFKDIGKRASDLITKDFPKEQKAEWKSTTADGVKLEFSIKNEEGRDGSKITGALKNEYTYKPWNNTTTVELNTEREFKAETSFTPKFVKGLKTIFSVQSQKKDGSLDYFSTVGAEFKNEFSSFTVSSEVGRANDNALKGSLVFGSQGAAVGINGEFLRKEQGPEFKEVKSSVSYASDEFDFVAYGKVAQARNAKRSTELGASYFHKISSDLQIGTEVKFDVSSEDKKPSLTFGSAYKLNNDATLKTRVDTSGVVGLSLAQQVNKTTKLLVGANINTAAPAKSGTNFGFLLTINA